MIMKIIVKKEVSSFLNSSLKIKVQLFDLGCEDSEEEDDYDGDDSEEDEGMDEQFEEAMAEGRFFYSKVVFFVFFEI